MKKILSLVLLTFFFPCFTLFATDMSKGTFSRFHYGTGLGPGGGTPVTGTITITTPVPYQVFQRNVSTGNIIITGTYTGNPSRIEARFNGGDWTTIVSSPSGNTYSGSFLADQGQGTLEVRFGNNAAINASQLLVGIGEVFMVAGQSNAVGQGINLQSYSSTDGFKAGLFANDYTWKELTDPYDSSTGQIDAVSNDGAGTHGSWVVLLATQIMNSQHVPVAFIPAAKNSSSSTAWLPATDHQNRATLYGSSVYRALQVPGGIRAVLWWQGETDASISATQAQYYSRFSTIASAYNTDLGAKVMPSTLANNPLMTAANQERINAAIAQAWASNTTTVLPGPTLSDLEAEDQYGHLRTNGKLQTTADRFFVSLQDALGW